MDGEDQTTKGWREALPCRVRLVEVSPRDGLQNEPAALAVETKLELIERLAAAGLPEIEFGSFVSPRWVPQLADAEQIAARLPKGTGTLFSALVPNMKGMRRALAARVRSVSLFTAASDTFNRKNTNATVEESFRRFRPVFEAARLEGVRVRGYVSTAFACPYEGKIEPKRAVAVAARLFEGGAIEVSIGDTIGVAAPPDVEAFLEAARPALDLSRLAFHFHDTRATGLVNVLAALRAGVATFDVSAGGMGGCPYVPGAGGNLATEDLIYLLTGMGIETGVDIDAVADASERIEAALGRPLPSKVYRAILLERAAAPRERQGRAGA